MQFLQAAIIPQGHWYYLFLKGDDVLILWEMVRLLEFVMMLNDRISTAEGKTVMGSLVKVQIYAADCSQGLQES